MSTRPEGFWTWIKSCYDTLRKALQITLDVYYFYIILSCENMVLSD